jgi:hypothetical protein
VNAKAGDAVKPAARKRLAQLCGNAPLKCIPDRVIAKHDGNTGQWICIDCGEPFSNNWQASSHESEKPKHRLAWRTVNGFEEP